MIALGVKTVLLRVAVIGFACQAILGNLDSNSGDAVGRSGAVNYSGGSRQIITHRKHPSSSTGGVGGSSVVVRYFGTSLKDLDDDSAEYYKTCSLQDCMPYIQMKETIELSLEQRLQVQRKIEFISRWWKDYKLFGKPASIRHTPIVTLTRAQKIKILSQYGNYFSTLDELPSISSKAVRYVREKRSSISICPREEQWDDLVMGMTSDDKAVQVVQFPDTGDKQWIMDERCRQEECSFVSNCGCSAHTRLVRAAVISFDQSMVAEKYIKVYCCIAMLIR